MLQPVPSQRSQATNAANTVALPPNDGTVELREVQKTYPNGYVATEDITLHIAGGSFFTLLGPSGCGKTTLLRIIAGFENPSGGEVYVDGKSLIGTPPFRRPVNTVFQSYVLFPHLTVYENIAFGLRMRHVQRPLRKQKITQILESMQLDNVATRLPSQLSGGQKQRVALARALINEPKILLLDEPLSALDAKLRKELQVELLRLQKHIGTTFLFVTHDQQEAMVMSDEIGIMHQGRLQQVGKVHDVYEHPRNTFVARFLGLPNIMRRDAIKIGASLSPHTQHVTVHPERILLSTGDRPYAQDENLFHGVVKERLYMGRHTEYVIAIEGLPDLLVAETSPTHGQRMPGSTATVIIRAADIVALEG